ncbi:MAG TPA: acyl-CoA dehydrogenase family protein, partial [Microthrixaceae bacterium]|nr:acyl-CoA dehydrogenase family protein [Microthrixaceae bacterium]
MTRPIFTDDHEMFREAYRSFVERSLVPRREEWEAAGIVSRDVWEEAGAAGFLAFDTPEEYGGPGVKDFRYNLVVVEELARAGAMATGAGFTLHSDVALPYFLRYCNDEQKQRWLPGMANGTLITAIAMTEPAMGSDLAGMQTTAIRDGDTYLLNGSKTFITNGINSDLVIVAAKTDPTQRHKGMSLLVVERDMEGFERGRNLDKIGLHAQDTAELFFNDVRVPAENLLGEEGTGFLQLVANLPQERLGIAAAGIAHGRAAFDQTLHYTKERTAFGQPIGSFQNSRFKLAEMATELEIGQTFVDRCVMENNAGTLTAETASMAKWWCTELQKRVMDACLQLHGG